MKSGVWSPSCAADRKNYKTDSDAAIAVESDENWECSGRSIPRSACFRNHRTLNHHNHNDSGINQRAAFGSLKEEDYESDRKNMEKKGLTAAVTGRTGINYHLCCRQRSTV